MEPCVLVTYATRSGSTEELARTIADVLRENGLPVELLPAKNVRSLERYSAVVLAAPLYMFRLHKDARRFLSMHRDALIKIPVALFVPGPFENEEKQFADARRQLDKELTRFSWLTPVAQHIVGGKFDPAGLGFPFNLIPAMRRIPASDARDWEAIRAMAKDLAASLQPASH
jgi:menaquinone-dependent protoporphyrinogen oxidase